MKQWQFACLAVVSAVVLIACDLRGRGYEDVRLARLSEGESTEQDVRKLFGTPAAVREMAGGKGLIYPLGPEGLHTLLIKFDAAGRYKGREDLLTRENFARLRRGMNKVEVLGMFGQPARTQKYPSKQQTAWEWRFLDAGEARVFVVTFDMRGTVADSSVEDDAKR